HAAPPLFPYTTLFRSQALHQPALSASSVILMNYAFHRGTVQRADRFHNRLFRDFGIFRLDGYARFCYIGASAPADDTIAKAAFRSEEHTSELQSRENL